ncbi:MAG: hypothetical protein ACJATT_001303 [Myxococcota bacterium]|jgi:hypothetical protein
MDTPHSTEASPRSSHAVLAVAILGIVLCPFLGPVAIYMADTERKRAMVDDYEPTQLLMIARVLGYVGTAILCLDLIGLMIIGIVLAMGIGG